ncbi:hypothetical protein BCR44DRAFT_1509239 [Catenaria anguillulae PL171]|uniref:T-cell immunomodulatory protein TIP C2 domain-containing protein n=1 Tax=Catenaria anguillulae PL171 TaxID=765915 RepID=A0A1Y2I4H6_9FUNG|nr:hypothetical protein BCR44DRAFT_1509239 [Catenaria anguillulae PL171]
MTPPTGSPSWAWAGACLCLPGGPRATRAAASLSRFTGAVAATVATIAIFATLLSQPVPAAAQASSSPTTGTAQPKPIFRVRQSIDNANLVAFGDSTGNKLADLFVIDRAKRSVSVHTWDPKLKSFQPPHAPALTLSSTLKDHEIANVVAGDFNADGQLDLLLTMAHVHEASTYHTELYLNTNGSYVPTGGLYIAGTVGAQPMLADVSGNMFPDLIAVPKDNGTHAFVWLNTRSEPGQAPKFALEGVPMNSTMCVPTDVAFVDVDGDCKPDMFVVCERHATGHEGVEYQIWSAASASESQASPQQQWDLIRSGSLPLGAGPISFADIDADGTLDAMYTVCTTECTLHVVYNQQIPLCTSTSPNSQSRARCRDLSNLCSRDPSFRLDFTSPSIIPVLRKDTGGAWASSDVSRLHLGDFNLDGYPDVLFVSGGSVTVLQNVPCSAVRDVHDCAHWASVDPRSFVALSHGIPTGRGIVDAAWFDLDENGSLDIVVRQISRSNVPSTLLYENTLALDAFFVKTLTTGAECTRDCHAHSVNSLGSSFKLTVIDTKGVKKAIQLTQTYATSNQALQLPYALTGLGRTNNYIEELAVGVSRADQHPSTNTFQGVIPNSQLVIYPRAGGASWRLELFINPSQYAVNVLVVLVVSLVVLGVVVGVMQWVERREDEREKIFL